jgi:hypothetical protein
VPQHRTQVSWTTGAGRLLCIEKRLPNSTGLSFARSLQADGTLSIPG